MQFVTSDLIDKIYIIQCPTSKVHQIPSDLSNRNLRLPLKYSFLLSQLIQTSKNGQTTQKAPIRAQLFAK